MLKIILILIFLPSLFLFLNSEKPETSSDSFPIPSPTKTPSEDKQNGVENLILDNETVYLPCAPEAYGCPEAGVNVKVKVLSKDAEKNNLNYYYEVSGGKIIGQGADVIWDLSQTRLGEYTITAGVGSNNTIRGKTLTRTVEIKECDSCHFICECPTINVSSAKKNVNKGEIIEFKVIVNGGTQEEVKYNWTVENGVIFEGQGTSNIKVQVLAGDSVTTIVEIGGLCETCPNTDSESVKISN